MIARLVIVRTQLFLRHLHQALLVVETRIGVPHGEEGVDMGFRVGFVVVTGIGVGHGVFLGVNKKLYGGLFGGVRSDGFRTCSDSCWLW